MSALHGSTAGAGNGVSPAAAGGTPVPRPVRLVTGAVAGVLLVASLALPLWQARLAAPQYPGGLVMKAYGGKVTGDVTEINGLNHYVGMKAFEADDIPELSLWLPTIALALVLVGLITFTNRRWLRRLTLLGLWVTPLAVLADVQFRLYQYGHDLSDEAPLRIEPFTPWAVGKTKVWNFNTTAFPGLGLIAVALAAAVLTFGPWAWRRAQAALAERGAERAAERAGARSAVPTATAAIVMALLLGAAGAVGVVGATPAFAAGEDAGTVDHSDHGSASEGSGGGSSSPSRFDAGASDAVRAAVDAPDVVATDGTLQRMIDDAADGATVFVPPGIHHGNFVIDHPIVLDGGGMAILDAGGVGTVLAVRAAGAVVMGLGVRNTGQGPVDAPTGILVTADDVVVHDVVVTDAYHGIAIQAATGVEVHDNRIVGRGGATTGASHLDGHDVVGYGPGDGVSVWNATSVLVRDNVIEDVRDGIYLSFGHGVLADRNTVRASRFAVHDMYTEDLTLSENLFEHNAAGMVLMQGGPVFALRNVVTDSTSVATGYGLLVKDVVDVLVTENLIVRNRIGVKFETFPTGTDTERVELFRNTIGANGTALVLSPTVIAAIGGNSFVSNTIPLTFAGGRGSPDIVWAFRGAGNYWDDYRGIDNNGDGIGERPYEIGSGVERLLARAPQLAALNGSAALRVLSAMDDRLQLGAPLGVDDRPLVYPVSPALPTGDAPTRAVPAAALAALALAASALAWYKLRAPRPMGGAHALA